MYMHIYIFIEVPLTATIYLTSLDFKYGLVWKLLIMCTTVKHNKDHLCRSLALGAGMPKHFVSGLGVIPLAVALAAL